MFSTLLKVMRIRDTADKVYKYKSQYMNKRITVFKKKKTLQVRSEVNVSYKTAPLITFLTIAEKNEPCRWKTHLMKGIYHENIPM